ncbi:MAG TPA: hypothetical protein VD907_06515 [Verrucomicrobiae bacterium]|nr:hypothetical protein [Verrucomicrobiae bacterium]
MNLYLASIIATFGRRYLWRLLGLVASAGCMGLIGFLAVKDMPIMSPEPVWPLIASGAFATQCLILLTLVAASGVLKENRDTVIRLLHVLPTNKWQKWAVRLFPSVVMGLLMLICIAPVLLVVLGNFGISPLFSIVALILGLLSALGLYTALPHKYFYIHIMLGIGAVWGQFSLVQTLTNLTLAEPVRLQSLIWFCALQVVLVTALFYSSTYTTIYTPVSRQFSQTFGRFLPRGAWLIKKVLRASNTKASLLAAFGISLVVAYISSRQGHTDPGLLTFVAAFMIAAVCSDIRSSARRNLPAEITALKGTSYFVVTQLLSVVPLCALVVSPLIITVVPQLPLLESIAFITQLLLSTAIGLFAGTLIMPQKRDIAGQFLAALLCIVLLYALPEFTFIASFDITTRMISDLVWYAALAAASFYLERKRNNYTWKG